MKRTSFRMSCPPAVAVVFAWLAVSVSFTAEAAVFTVTNVNDTGVGSLRWAIGAANSNAGPDSIQFNIPGPGPHVIDVATPLPTLTNTGTSVLGDTQPGYAGTPLVEIHGPTPEFFDIGIWVQANDCTVRGLRMTGFNYFGVSFDGSYSGSKLEACLVDNNNEGVQANHGIIGGVSSSARNIIISNTLNGISSIVLGGTSPQILGNFIGVAADGVTPAGNGENGIKVRYSQNVTIRGGDGYPQIISGHSQNGIFLSPNGSYVQFCSNITIQGNFIGTDITGTNAIPNNTGIYIWGGLRNTIGGTSPGQRNVIAGNHGKGIDIAGIKVLEIFGHSNTVYGNYIGLGADGETPLPNDVGVQVTGGWGNRIGGASPGQGNHFGQADFEHVWINAGSLQAYSNTVQGNLFGFSASTQTLTAGRTGVRIGSASNNLVGGATAGARNYFGGVDTGVYIDGTNARNNRVIGNWIGVKPDGTASIIHRYGVEIYHAPNNEVGGTTADEQNVIGACQWYGIRIHGAGSSGNLVQGNLLGADPTSSFSISNRYAGVDIAGGAYSNRIGPVSFSAAAANVFIGNAGSAVVIRDAETYGNVVANNLIGFTRFFTAFSNQSYGIDVYMAPSNQIGPGNYVGNHPTTGIRLSGSNAVGNRVIGNIVGTDVGGNLHPNGMGIGSSAPGTLIGGPSIADRNIVSGNNVNGVDIGEGGHGSTIQGNLIGLNAFGTGVVSNRQYGISVNNANNVVIGGLNAARNIIAGSRLTGIVVGGSSSNTIIAGNYLGTTESGTVRLGIGTAGIGVDADHTIVGLPFAGLGNIIAGAGAGAIEVNAGSNVVIRNNRVGIGADGVTNLPNARGIVLRANSRNVRVGGTNFLDANVIARNSGMEVWVDGPSAGNTIQGNYIGVQFGGAAFPTGNGGIGIEVVNSPDNRILGNVIGQVQDAIFLRNTGSLHNVIQGNFIGEYNLEPIPNTGWGIYILNASGNTIGGLPQSERNLITRNGGGVVVTNNSGFSAVNNRIAANLIHGNTPGLNIDLGPQGPTSNDGLDIDVGANGLQNKPFITNAVTTGSGILYAQGTLGSAPNTSYALDIYRSSGSNAEAFRYIGRTYVETDHNGNGEFTAGFPYTLSAGQYLVGTATDPDGNTSELFASSAGATLITTADGDNDGIPDYWEALYGLNPAVSNSPAADLDADGVGDVAEYLADTAANQSGLYPVIVDLTADGSREVTFPSSNLRVYSLETGTNLFDAAAWTQVGGSVTGLYGVTTMTDPNPPGWSVYRVSARLP